MNRKPASRLLDLLRKKLPLLVFCFCLAQPVLDVMGYWQSRLGLSNALTLGLRMLLLGATLLLGFLLSERKKAYILCGVILGIFTIFHALACVLGPNGYRQPVQDLVNLVRIYFLPLTTLCFISFLRQDPKVRIALRRGLLADLLLIALVQGLSALTGTDPHTYHLDGVGVLGWFLWTNSQSAILAMLLPLALCWALERWPDRVLPVALCTLICGLPLYLLAPRLAYACLLACGMGLGGLLVLFFRSRWKQGLAMLLVSCLFLAAYPISPTAARQRMVGQRNDSNQEYVERKYGQEDLEPGDLSGYEAAYHSLTTVYEVVERFGLQRTLEAYDYTLDASVLGSARLKKLTYCKLLMEDAGLPGHLFGLNLSEMFQFIRQGFRNEETGVWEDGYASMDVENDLHGIYYLTGWVGLGLMAAFLLAFPIRALLWLLKDPKGRFSPWFAALCGAYLCAMLHAACTASVLRRNNASVYLAVILAFLWDLCTERKEDSGCSKALRSRANVRG